MSIRNSGYPETKPDTSGSATSTGKGERRHLCPQIDNKSFATVVFTCKTHFIKQNTLSLTRKWANDYLSLHIVINVDWNLTKSIHIILNGKKVCNHTFIKWLIFISIFCYLEKKWGFKIFVYHSINVWNGFSYLLMF